MQEEEELSSNESNLRIQSKLCSLISPHFFFWNSGIRLGSERTNEADKNSV